MTVVATAPGYPVPDAGR